MTDLHSIDLKNKYVGLRVDLNVPLESGEVLSPDRLSAALPTILYILEPVSYTHLTLPTKA